MTAAAGASSGAPNGLEDGSRKSGKLAFLTGCGRSGKSLIGRMLAHHPEVTVLDDRFDLWIEALPVTDIWGWRERQGVDAPRIALGADDAHSLPPDARSRFLSHLEQERRGRRVLVENLAINNFRLGFLNQLCPGAVIINIVRHGVEVARAIEEKIRLGQWYGRDDRKWSLLCEHARQHGYGELLPHCAGPYEQGLLEWRMSVEAAERFFDSNTHADTLRLSFERLVGESTTVLNSLCTAIGLEPDEAQVRFCDEEIARHNLESVQRPARESTEIIAGATLRRLGYLY